MVQRNEQIVVQSKSVQKSIFIMINRNNWRITIKLHFENISFFLKKRMYTHARTPPPPVCFCSLFNDPPPPPPLINEHTFWMTPMFLNSCLANCWHHKLKDISLITFPSNGWLEERGEREIQKRKYFENKKAFWIK